jgi:hypothetical protein
MKGIAFHWEPPYRDVYSGMDPHANAWADLAQAFNLEIEVISPEFPAPSAIPTSHSSVEAFMAAHPDDDFIFADYSTGTEFALSPTDEHWLVIGPAMGWPEGAPGRAWKCSVTPNGGWHSLHLAHVAAAMMR